MRSIRPLLLEVGAVLAAVKDASRRCAVAWRPSLTAAARGAIGMVRPGRGNGHLQPNQETAMGQVACHLWWWRLRSRNGRVSTYRVEEAIPFPTLWKRQRQLSTDWPTPCQPPKATPKIYRVAGSEAFRNFVAGDSGAGKYFLDSLDDRHISDSRTVHGG